MIQDRAGSLKPPAKFPRFPVEFPAMPLRSPGGAADSGNPVDQKPIRAAPGLSSSR